jgi:hypothetical protein
MVAVKRFGENASVRPETIYRNEVNNIMALEHENIIKLVGYCHQPNEKLELVNGRLVIQRVTETLLCYEYLSRGGLHLFGTSHGNLFHIFVFPI